MIGPCCSGVLSWAAHFLSNTKKVYQMLIYNNVKKTKYVFYHNKYY